MKAVKIFTKAQHEKSKANQTVMPNQIANLPEGTRIFPFLDDNGNARVKEWSNGEVVVLCRVKGGPLVNLAAAQFEKIEGVINDDTGSSLPENKEIVVTHKRMALVDAE